MENDRMDKDAAIMKSGYCLIMIYVVLMGLIYRSTLAQEIDSIYQAKILDQPIGQQFDHPDDENWAMFYATSGVSYTISIQNPEAYCDTMIRLLNTDGSSEIMSENAGGIGQPETIQWTCPDLGTGIYYINIRYGGDPDTFQTNDNGYMLTLSNSEGSDAYEPDDTSELACVIMIGDVPQRHWFHDAGDADWVKFHARVGISLVIKVSEAQTRCDAAIELYDASGNPLKKKDYGSYGADEHLDYSFNVEGIYYVRIISSRSEIFGENTGYSLSVYEPIATYDGFLCGKVQSDRTGDIIAGTTVGTSNGNYTISLNNGFYRLYHESGTYTLEANAPDYCSYIEPYVEIKPILDPDNREHPIAMAAPVMYYKDVDDDGYSDGIHIESCSRPTGYKPVSELISISGDCDDSNSDIHNDSTVICDLACVIRMLRMLTGIPSPSPVVNVCTADLSGNGRVDMQDAVWGLGRLVDR